MAWNSDEEQPTRTREELLHQVTQRGEALRRRRRAGRGVASGVLVLAAVAVVGSVATRSDGKERMQVATDGPSTTSPLAAIGPGDPDPRDEPAPTTLPDPLSPSATDTAPTSPASSLPGGSPPRSTVTSAPTRTTRPAAVSTAAPPGPRQPRCGPVQLAVTVTPSKPAFGPDEPVHVTSTLRNQTSAPCYYTSSTTSFEFRNVAGRGFEGGAVHADGFADTALEAGQTLTQTWDWNQRDCRSPGDPRGSECVLAPRGDYTVSVRWDLDAGTATSSSAFGLIP